MELDHAVLWVESAKRSLDFYVNVLGLTPVRAEDFEEGRARRLEEHGVELSPGGEDVFGARGQAVRSVYFNDPDNNVLEIRYYDQ